MFEIRSINAVKKDLKKLSSDVIKEIKTLRENPFQADELKYAFRGLRSYHFNHKSTSYRIVYEVFEEDRLIIVIMIGTRESFYEKLIRRI